MRRALNAYSFDNDQYAEATVAAIITPGNWHYIGLSVRCSASAVTYYGYAGLNGDAFLTRAVAGTFTDLATGGSGFSATDVIRLEAEGTTITPMIDGSTDASLGAQTDAAIASGSAGVAGWQDAGTGRESSRIDNWEGGNLGATQSNAPRAYHAQRRRS